MNGYQRIMSALKGEEPDRTPVMLHNFMPAAREYGVSMARFRRDPQLIANAFIKSVEKYGVDGVVVDVDTATLAGALGVRVDFPEDEPARAYKGCVGSLQELKDLGPPEIGGYPGVQVWLEAARLLRDYFRDEILVRGNCDQCPFSLAALMRSIEPWMMDLRDRTRRQFVFGLLDYCTEATIRFVRMMADAGAHMISNGDSLAGPEMISPEMYRTYALPYENRVSNAAHETGRPYVLHICGRTEPILEDLLHTGADGVELDQKTDAGKAQSLFRDRITFLGNIDPSGVLALGTPREVEKATRELLTVFAGNSRFILNSGCAIPPNAPSENLMAMVNAVRS